MSSEVVDVQQLIAAARPFEEWYLSLQEHFPRIQLNPTDETIPLVTGQMNSTLPIHRWYNLKESFSAELPLWLYYWMREHYQHTPTNILDAFMGSGTTGVSLAQLGVQITGVEYNPFICFVAATKAAVTQVSPLELEEAIARLETEQLVTASFPMPLLSTLHNPKYSNEQDIQVLLAMYQRISTLGVSSAARAMLHLGVAATIDAVFHLHKDGRALRYKPKVENRSVCEVLSWHWRNILLDLQAYHEQQNNMLATKPLFDVYKGSSINLQTIHTLEGADVSLANDCFDTIIYSPPYLNNFDYTEIYKLELWLLKFVETYDIWKNLRLGTLRSHHSIAFNQTQHLASDPRTQEIATHLKAMSESICFPKSEQKRVGRVIEGYFDDMYLALREQWRVLKPGGILTYIVANSRHYYLPVATDIILSEIACCIGFESLDLVVLRKRNGRTRQKLFLRESAVFLQKPVH